VGERSWHGRLRCLLWLTAAAAAAGCGGQAAEGPREAAPGDPGPVHVHGLGVNPADGSLFVATHTGLFRAAPTEQRARRVADRYQDTMGFTVVGPDHFLGSGHPDGREQLPPFLGLIESRDAGRTWRAVSLQGKVDFHILESSGQRIYGYGSDWESREPRFLASSDGGRHWRRLEVPEPLVSLAISPGDSRALVASGDRRLFHSKDGGGSWSAIDAPSASLVAWTRGGVTLVGLDGSVWHGSDPLAGRWRRIGSIGGEPSALDTGLDGQLLVALHDGAIKQSTDAGRNWSVRSRP
jgi:hypothetical protein